MNQAVTARSLIPIMDQSSAIDRLSEQPWIISATREVARLSITPRMSRRRWFARAGTLLVACPTGLPRRPAELPSSSTATSGRSSRTPASSATARTGRSARRTSGSTRGALGGKARATPTRASSTAASPPRTPTSGCRPPKSGQAAHAASRSSCSAAGSSRGRSGRSTGRSSRRSGRPLPRSGKPAGPATRSTRSSSPGSNARASRPRPRPTAATLIRRVTLDLTGLPPTPRRGRRLPRRHLARRLREGRRSPARLAPLRRADGRPLARRRPLRRHQRLPDRRRAHHVALARLGDRRLQPQHAVRPVHRSSSSPATCCPNATLDQQIATGFNRNHRGNAEGGIIPEEYAVEYVVDRVETTATVWLGLTLGCARCHDHKFDPFTQQEFYQLFAFFNNVPEKRPGGQVRQLAAAASRRRRGSSRSSSPRSTTRARPSRRRSELRSSPRSARREHRTTAPGRRLGRQPARCRARRRSTRSTETPDASAMASRLRPGPVGRRSARRQALRRRRRRRRLRLLRQVHARRLDPARRPAGRHDRLAHGRRRRRADGYSVRARRRQGPGQPRQALARRRAPRRDRATARRRSLAPRRRHLRRLAASPAGVKVYVDGQPRADRRAARRAEPDVPDEGAAPHRRRRRARRPLPRRRSTTSASTTTALAAEDVAIAGRRRSRSPRSPPFPPAQRTPGAGREAPRAVSSRRVRPQSIRQADATCSTLRERARRRSIESFPTTMVMEEMPAPRETHVLIRGEYDKPGEQVDARRARRACRRCRRDSAAEPARPRALARRPGQPADGARRGQSLLADALRHRPGEDGRGLRRRRASRRAIPSCSTGWRPSSSGPAGT